MRYLTKFTKEENIKFISHLDVLKTIQKNIRRAGLPVEFSQGFNPHMNTSIAQPLSVGVYSISPCTYLSTISRGRVAQLS